MDVFHSLMGGIPFIHVLDIQNIHILRYNARYLNLFGYCHASKISIHLYRIWAHIAIEVAVSAIYGLVFEFLGKMVFQNSCYDHVGYSGCIVTAVIIINHSIAVLIRYVVIITLVHSQIFLYSMISLYYSWIWVSLGL